MRVVRPPLVLTSHAQLWFTALGAIALYEGAWRLLRRSHRLLAAWRHDGQRPPASRLLWLRRPFDIALERLENVSPSTIRRVNRPMAMNVLRQVSGIDGTLGIDVGGTLAKCVTAERLASPMPAEFGDPGNDSPAGMTHADLALTIRRRHRANGLRSGVGSATTSELSSSDNGEEESFSLQETYSMQFMSGPTAALEDLLESTERKRRRASKEDVGGAQRPRPVAATGGGAHKLRARVLEEFNVRRRHPSWPSTGRPRHCDVPPRHAHPKPRALGMCAAPTDAAPLCCSTHRCWILAWCRWSWCRCKRWSR